MKLFVVLLLSIPAMTTRADLNMAKEKENVYAFLEKRLGIKRDEVIRATQSHAAAPANKRLFTIRPDRSTIDLYLNNISDYATHIWGFAGHEILKGGYDRDGLYELMVGGVLCNAMATDYGIDRAEEAYAPVDKVNRLYRFLSTRNMPFYAQIVALRKAHIPRIGSFGKWMEEEYYKSKKVEVRPTNDSRFAEMLRSQWSDKYVDMIRNPNASMLDIYENERR